MNEETHFLIARKAFETLNIDWMLNVSDSELRYWVLVPDKIDKDNLSYGYWYHSRKMEMKKGKLQWKHGSVILAISGLRWMIKNCLKEGDFKEARENLIKMSHYITDAMTIPHLVYKKLDDYHSCFERDIEKSSPEIIPELELSVCPLKYKNSVYDSLVYECNKTYEDQADIIKKLYDSGAEMNTTLKKQILKRCLQCNLDFMNTVL